MSDASGPHLEVRFGDRPIRLPLFQHDDDVFGSLHTASYDAVAETLPGELLRPMRWLDGRALISITASRHRAPTSCPDDEGRAIGMTPYGEVSVAALVRLAAAASTASEATALRLRRRGYLLHLPVTTAQARDGYRSAWGCPAFVADLDIVEDPASRQVRVSDGGSTILDLTVRPRGPVVPAHTTLVSYTTRDEQLIETVVPTAGRAQLRFGSRAADLRLGLHETGVRLRALEISPTPVLAFSYLDHRAVLPMGTPFGPAPAHDTYAGTERDHGRYTVAYPGGQPIDQYAHPSEPAV